MAIDIDIDVFEKSIYINNENIYIPLITVVKRQKSQPEGVELRCGFSTENLLIIDLKTKKQNSNFSENGKNCININLSLFYDKDIKKNKYLCTKVNKVLENDSIYLEKYKMYFLLNRESSKTIFYGIQELESLSNQGLVVISKDNNFAYIAAEKEKIYMIDIIKNKFNKDTRY